MDVRCERCQTEYEFDEKKVPARGLSVKCSQCGHVFWVSKNPAVGVPPQMPGQWPERTATGMYPATPGEEPDRREWRLRRLGGKEYVFDDWATLQRWIVERKATTDDEVARTGESWRRLGDIPELETFFQAARQSEPEPAASGPTHMGNAPQNKTAWTFGESGEDPIGAGLDAAIFESSRKGRGMWALLAAFGVLLGAAALVLVLQPQLASRASRFLGFGADTAVMAERHTKNGYRALLEDTPLSMDRSIEAFQKALSLQPEADRAKAGWALAEMRRAALLRAEVERLRGLLEAAGKKRTKSLKAEINTRSERAVQRSEKARQLATSILDKNANAVMALVALADHNRFEGNVRAMKQSSERVLRQKENQPHMHSVLADHAADADEVATARQHFQTALAQEPRMNRARYGLAALWADKQPAKARAQLQDILQQTPDHARAQALLTAMDEAAEQKAAAKKAEEREKEKEKQQEKQKAPPPQPTRAPPPEPTAEQVLAQADRLRTADRAEEALPIYHQALEMAPNNADVHTGMGWCYLDLMDPVAAVEHFSAALELAPRKTDAHMGLAEAYRMRGMKRDAIKHYRRYLAILPTGPEAPVARRMIEKLEQ